MRVVFDHSEEVAHDSITFYFQPEHSFDYTAGQFIELTLPHKHPDNRGQKRWFTLSSSPTENLISITTKRARTYSSTFKQLLFGIKPGTEIIISEAMGDFVLPKDPTISLYFIAGGIGITPVRSMIKWLIDKNQKRTVHILYAEQKLENIAFTSLFDSYGATTNILLSQPPPTWKGYIGHPSKELILKLYPQQRALVYISGPEQMVELLEVGLLRTEILPQDLVLDFFPGYKNL